MKIIRKAWWFFLFLSGIVTLIIIFLILMFGADFWKIGMIWGGSMEPEIKHKEIAVYQITDNIKIGDIAVFRAGDRIIAHRVIGVIDYPSNNIWFITKGDANQDVEKVESTDVIGRIIWHTQEIASIIYIPLIILSFWSLSVSIFMLLTASTLEKHIK